MNKINTILFDLDGTLLSINMNDFENIYYKSLSESFKDLISPDEFMKILKPEAAAALADTDHNQIMDIEA